MSIELNFPRDYYLDCAEDFESSSADCIDQELSEFNGDAEDIAHELAYTRYSLAKKEAECEALLSQVTELRTFGQYMSNILFNLKQSDTLSDTEKALAEKWQRHWDKNQRNKNSGFKK